MKQHFNPDEALESLFRSNDSASGLSDKDSFRSGNGFFVRVPSLATASKVVNSQDASEAEFMFNFMKQCEDELNKHQKGMASLSILRSAESATYISKILNSNMSQESYGEPLPLKSAASGCAEDALLKEDLDNVFSTHDWVPLDDCEDAKKVDDSLVAHFYQSRPSQKVVKEFLEPSSGSVPVPCSNPRKTDWDSLYLSKLPPTVVPKQGCSDEPHVEEEEDTIDLFAEELPKSTAPQKKVASKPVQKRKKATTSKKRTRKQYEPEVKAYVEPTDDDVLFGRGGRSNLHPGNIRYHEAKLRIQPRYLASTKEEKTGVSQELVDEIHAYGGRFLKLDEGQGWYEVLEIVARKKVSQALREENTPERRQAKRARYAKRSSRRY